jgi:Flp pilus assembly protein TadG
MTGSTRPRSESGNAIVELAVALPMMVMLLVGTADFARVFYQAIELTNAARAGVQWGARDPGSAVDSDGMRTAAINAVNITGMTFPVAPPWYTCECANAAGTFSPTSPGPNNCTDPPATSCPSAGTFRVITVSVTVTKTFNTIARYPGIPASIPLSRTAIMRVSE